MRKLTVEEKLKIIIDDTEEAVTKEKISNILRTREKPISYWGVAPTGPPHIGYYRTISKQMDLIKAGFHHKILIADIHAYLDDMKTPWDEIDIRGQIYKKCFQLLGLDGPNIEYITGKELQLNKNYQLEFLKASAMITLNRAIRAASEVVRMADPKISSVIYPLMQSLDCWALNADLAYAGIDNRHVYMLASSILPKLGHKVPAFIFTPLGIGLSGDKKMSASNKIDRLELFAEPDDIKYKINKAFCAEGELKNNPILEYCKYLIFPRVDKFIIKRAPKFGGNLEFINFEDLKNSFQKKELHPQDLKNATAEYLIEILKPIKEYFNKNKYLLKTFEI